MAEQIEPSGAVARTDRQRNFILATIPDPEYAQLHDALTPVELTSRDPIYSTGGAIHDVYFPVTAVLSMIAEVDGEPAVEVATIGREGMSGLPVFLGVGASPNTVFAQVPGRALRLPVERLRDVLSRDGHLHRQLHRYIQATLVQLAQNVACNRMHNSEQRAARWLMMTADRVDAERFPLTQEFLAQMLGVRRATVSLTAGALQEAGLISYSRGVITIRDRAGLEATSCECYRVVREEFDQLMRQT
ncbi:Crp/Fnr family transcriptional regulator [Plantactinospora sp. BB1]|uniref:Crp/Fnr family transcriptional regulator n=1 Tax=Plantactinospora sp. BB1 TaxID=2071627 RepID=UPI00131EF06A|nr:Crp/Fnr family transcriptional regulator [Plantactinospora sp. BB1]